MRVRTFCTYCAFVGLYVFAILPQRTMNENSFICETTVSFLNGLVISCRTAAIQKRRVASAAFAKILFVCIRCLETSIDDEKPLKNYVFIFSMNSALAYKTLRTISFAHRTNQKLLVVSIQLYVSYSFMLKMFLISVEAGLLLLSEQNCTSHALTTANNAKVCIQ